MWSNVVCSERSITNGTAFLYGTTIMERCSHVFPCRAANQPDGNRNLLLWMVFLPLATTVERTTGSNFNWEICRRWEYISSVAFLFFERLFPCFTIATFFPLHLWLWKNQLIRHIVPLLLIILCTSDVPQVKKVWAVIPNDKLNLFAVICYVLKKSSFRLCYTLHHFCCFSFLVDQ